MNFETLKNTVRVKVREETNPMLGKFRRKKLKDPNVTIISNNCWGGTFIGTLVCHICRQRLDYISMQKIM